MCGFVGIVNVNNDLNLESAKRAQESIIHRGPDYQGHYTDNQSYYLGHNRLSIIDVSEHGNQPFFDESGQVAIIFNGEIYNYKSLKSRLKDVHFKTGSDTEVLLNGFLIHGRDFFKELRGIYAFGIYDFRNGLEVTVARDPAGVKPLYFLQNRGQFIIGSEIKAIKAASNTPLTRNHKVLESYVQLGYCPEPQTAFNEINCVEPGKCIRWSRSEGIRETINIKLNIDQSNALSFDENLHKSESLIQQAVSRNLTADVTCSVALSGGVDSSLIYNYAHAENEGIKGLTISFERETGYNEAEQSKLFAQHIHGDHEIIEAKVDSSLPKINELLLHFDQPFADTSLFPVYNLTKACRKYGKVLIGGDGGDELFNGYPFMYLMKYFYTYGRGKVLALATPFISPIIGGERRRQLQRVAGFMAGDVDHGLVNMNSWIPENSKWNGKRILNFDSQQSFEYLNSIFFEEKPKGLGDKISFYFYRNILLSDYLRKTDMMSMLNGVELRVPLLDEDLVEHAFTIPFDQKSTLKKTKIIPKLIQDKKYPGVPRLKGKSGFEIPLDKYIDPVNKQEICDHLLNDSSGIIDSFIDKDYVKLLCESFMTGNAPSSISRGGIYQKLILLYSLKIWSDNN